MLSRIAVVVLVVAAASPARAEIYTWRDANGNLVLSNQRTQPGAQVKTYAVPTTTNIRATRYVPSERGRLYDNLINEHARTQGVRADLVRAVMQVESAFNPYALSPKGAMGLMQLMPATARQYGVTNPYNPADNVRAGVAYLRGLLDRYQNNEELALAAYNAGPTAVDRHGQNIPPYRETQNYVLHINQLAGAQAEARAGSRIYKVTEVVDGQPVVRYTDKKPSTGTFALVGR